MHVLLTFSSRLLSEDGTVYTARACGGQRGDGRWEGWLEFFPDDATPAVRSQRETTQPNLTNLEYWATGLTPIYLEGALARALSSSASRRDSTPGDARDAILDPFAVYAAGAHVLRQQLRSLTAWHLRAIIRAHGLVDATIDPGLEALDEPQLIALIVTATRERMAA